MVSPTLTSWTLIGLIRAFIGLALAFVLLCGSTLGFFAWKLYHVFGLYLPCPCSGFLGYQNSNLCWHNLLIHYPVSNIHSALKLPFNRFPFNLIRFNDQDWGLDAKSIELLGEACPTSPSGLRLQTIVNKKKSSSDTKGKKSIYLKHKSKVQRGRIAAFGYRKSANFSVADASSVDGGETMIENWGLVSGIEDCFPGNITFGLTYVKPAILDDKNTQSGNDLSEATWHGFELSSGEGKGNTNEKFEVTGDEANRFKILEQAIKEEKAACAALHLELEKERAASASAADEAMAMILRLQEDKASIEMEAMQYQRMIEEKFAYDEEEMNLLKETLVGREKENHLLEKEVEAYRQMDTRRDKPEECDFFRHDANKGGQIPSVSLGLGEDPLLMGNSGSTRKNEMGKGSSWPSEFETPSEKLSHTVVVNLTGKGKGQDDDDTIVCQAITRKTSPSFGGTSLSVDELERNSDCEPLGRNLRNSTFDMEPTVYDVHVIDDNKESPKEENSKKSKLRIGSASDHKTFLYDLERSSSAVSNERLEIDAEIEHLTERLQIVGGEKEKLTSFADQRERIDILLKLIKEQVKQLREFQRLKEPVQLTSLTPLSPSSKVVLHFNLTVYHFINQGQLLFACLLAICCYACIKFPFLSS
ncbi:hypothetical protein Goshw_029895 [Gossypium schwendimanii]|uniref:GTD-binding domain-containing protein n=1 Tax=Gossypium schwendimanii TaxID=34291 RepID=A0A7J9KP29_GOSSC|nr:hypothetical protein [Gossypium schwendimanii]